MDSQINNSSVNTIQQSNINAIPDEVKSFLSGLLDDAGMTDLDPDMREEMIMELYVRLDNYLVSVIVDNMPDDQLDAFAKLNEEKKPREEIEKFVNEKIPNATAVFADAFAKFREMYLGGVSVARNAPKV